MLHGTALEPAIGEAAVDRAAPSASVAKPWWALGLSIRTLVCGVCDVSWNEKEGEACWMCGELGARLGDLTP